MLVLTNEQKTALLLVKAVEQFIRNQAIINDMKRRTGCLPPPVIEHKA